MELKSTLKTEELESKYIDNKGNILFHNAL